MTTEAAEPAAGHQTENEIDRIFRAAVKLSGSDLHLKVGKPPFVRINGQLRALNRGPIDDEEMTRLITPLLNPRTEKDLKENGGADFAYYVQVEEEEWRFRINVLRQLGHVGMVARRVNISIPPFEELHLPPIMEKLCKFDQGLILVSGPTGSGKSTTIASMLDWINHNFRKHIITLEDPVEFVFQEDKALITQREVGLDVKDFSHGMRQVVREDPDVVLLGEMRDHETFQTAIQAAATGHLVFGTLHASTAASTLSRIMDLFPAELHDSIRNAMSSNLKAVVAQKLLKSINEEVGRVPAIEVMLMTPSVSKLILTGEEDKLGDAIRIGAADGMQDFTMSLKQLIDEELIDRQTAYDAAPNVDALKMVLKGINVTQPGIL